MEIRVLKGKFRCGTSCFRPPQNSGDKNGEHRFVLLWKHEEGSYRDCGVLRGDVIIEDGQSF